MRTVKPQREYAPTRTGFRLRRLLRDKGFQKFATFWAPLAMIAAGAGWIALQTDMRAAAMAKMDEMKRDALDRPEFAIRTLLVEGADPKVEAAVRRRLTRAIGVSSLAYDADRARRRAQALGWVATAQARLEAPSTLRITITQNKPALIWRRGETLTLLGADGAPIERALVRSNHPDLPLVAGAGADTPRAVREALAIFASSGPLHNRMRGLVRVGERRWDIILADGPVVMLPSQDALDALAYVTSLESGPDKLLTKDVTTIDLRLADRRVLRLGPDALQSLEDGRAEKTDGEDA